MKLSKAALAFTEIPDHLYRPDAAEQASALAGLRSKVDGNFVCSTPSSVPVSMDNHEIAVRKKGYSVWDRRMNVTGGTVHLIAELERGR